MKAKYKISCSVAAILSAWAGVASAANQVAASDSASAAGGIEEIVVTAQRRSESIQDVPNTIQAFSGEKLAELQVTNFDDFVKHTPNVTFGGAGPGSGNIYIRGLSSGFANNQSSATIAPFPNVATYLDDQSLTFPYRNIDVYVVDMERIEVLEGPQGTLFGGGAEAGAIRYITNKPKLDAFSGYAEASGSFTQHGDPNYAVNAVFNIPIITDKLAVRGVFYNDRRGGYIDNVPSTFTRKPTDPGPAGYGSVYPPNPLGANNFGIASKNQNPVTYTGARLSALYDVNDDWNLLIQQSFQNLDAQGMDVQYPVGSDGQYLAPLSETSFAPADNRDSLWNTSWTVNGQISDLKIVYTGAFLSRRVDQTMDYTNYARTAGGFYYQCAGGPASGSNFGAGTPGVCYSPVGSWHDYVKSTHHTEELRVATPDDWRLRGLAGVFYENLDIKDDMNFLYRSFPSCTPANLALYKAGGPLCVATLIPAPGTAAIDPNPRNDSTAFGEDVNRGYKQEAVFLSIDYDIIPKVLTVTGGTRYYNYDEFEMGSQYGTSESCIGLPNGTCVGTPMLASDHAGHYHGFRSRGNVTWHITPDAMVYYTFSQGFRPGAGNRLNSAEVKIDVSAATKQATTGVDNNPNLIKQFNKPFTYAPDTLDNHEVGFKTEFLDRRLQLNGSAYYMKWNNVQTLIYNPPVYGNTTFGTNGPDYDIKGFELQAVIKPVDQITLDGSLSYNTSKETNSPCIKSTNAVALNPTPIGSCITQVWSASQHMNVPLVNPLGSQGATPAFSPDFQYNAQARYDWDMDAYRAFATLGVQYTASFGSQPSSFPLGPAPGAGVPTTTFLRYITPARTTLDASVGVSRDNWTATLYGTNLTDSHASTLTTSGQFIVSQVPLRPMVIGVRVGSKF